MQGNPTGPWSVNDSVFVVGDKWATGPTGPSSEDALRWMCNPTHDGVSTDYYPERYMGPHDHGGVHLNSGIANLMYCLLVRGGQHPRGKTSVTNRGVGAEPAARAVYLANNRYWTEHSTFEEACHGMVLAATDLQSHYPTLPADVRAAWQSVGVCVDAPVQDDDW